MNMNETYRPFDVVRRGGSVYMVVGTHNAPVIVLKSMTSSTVYAEPAGDFVDDGWEHLGNLSSVLQLIGEHFNGLARNT